MRPALILTLLLSSVSLSAPLGADTRYISDRLMVPLRSGPTNGHRILHRGLPSGTELEVLEEDPASSYARVRTEAGAEGWLQLQYLDPEPIARQQLSTAEEEIRRLTEALSDERSRAAELNSGKGSAEARSSRLSSELEQLQAAYDELQAISTGAVAQHAENESLTAMNRRLRGEILQLADQRDRLEARSREQVLLYGAGLVILGLLLGVLIKARPRQSAWR